MKLEMKKKTKSTHIAISYPFASNHSRAFKMFRCALDGYVNLYAANDIYKMAKRLCVIIVVVVVFGGAAFFLSVPVTLLAIAISFFFFFFFFDFDAFFLLLPA